MPFPNLKSSFIFTLLSTNSNILMFSKAPHHLFPQLLLPLFYVLTSTQCISTTEDFSSSDIPSFPASGSLHMELLRPVMLFSLGPFKTASFSDFSSQLKCHLLRNFPWIPYLQQIHSYYFFIIVFSLLRSSNLNWKFFLNNYFIVFTWFILFGLSGT